MLPPLLEVLGGGLVTWVTPLVNPVTLRTMPPAVDSTPRTIVAAKAAPGSVGNCTLRPPEEGAARDGVPAAGVGEAATWAQGR